MLTCESLPRSHVCQIGNIFVRKLSSWHSICKNSLKFVNPILIHKYITLFIKPCLRISYKCILKLKISSSLWYFCRIIQNVSDTYVYIFRISFYDKYICEMFRIRLKYIFQNKSLCWWLILVKCSPGHSAPTVCSITNITSSATTSAFRFWSSHCWYIHS